MEIPLRVLLSPTNIVTFADAVACDACDALRISLYSCFVKPRNGRLQADIASPSLQFVIQS